MKILLVGNYPLSHQESMLRFSDMLARGLTESGHQVKCISPRPRVCRYENAVSGLAKWLGYIDRFALFKRALKSAAEWADVIHICDHSNAMYAKWLSHKPVIVTCHDVMAIKSALGQVARNKTGFTGRLLQRWIASGLEAADHIACVSKNTELELHKIMSAKKVHTSVVYNALNYAYSPMEKEQALAIVRARLPSLEAPYFFHIGGNQWYKNRKGVVAIFSRLIKQSIFSKHYLVLAGECWTDELRSFVSAQGLSERVIEISKLSNEELRAFYSLMEALLFPSFEEGFGWPIVEAQACGGMVVTTARPPMNEVAGTAAVFVEPEFLDEAVCQILDDISKKSSLIQQGLLNVEQYRLDEMIASYVRSYVEVTKLSMNKKESVI